MGLNEFGELEAFLALAEELHFGNTAKRLHLSPGRVSQLIQALERRVQVRLVERTSRSVRLTAAGQFLLERAKPAFGELRSSIEDTARAYARRLRIGFLGPFLTAVNEAVAAYRLSYPDVPVHVTEIFWTDLFGPLRRGEIDVQVSVGPVTEPDLVAGPAIATYPRVAAVAAGHRLTRWDSLRLADLAGSRLLGLPPTVPKCFSESFMPPVTDQGDPISYGRHGRTQPEFLSLVAEGPEILLTSTALPLHYHHPGVAYVPVTGMSTAKAVLSWRTGAANPVIRDFVGALPRPRLHQMGSLT